MLQVYRFIRSRFYLLASQKTIKNREHLEKLASKNDVPGLKNIWVCKFIITGVDTKSPRIYYMDTKRFEHHYRYFKKISPFHISEQAFDKVTYYTNIGRHNLAGSIVARDNYKDEENPDGIYTIEYWPTDPVSYNYIKLSWDLINKTFSFAKNQIYHYLGSQTQIDQHMKEKMHFEQDSSIRLIDSDTLFYNLDFIPLNTGDSLGVLRILDLTDLPEPEDIVIFKSLPNDLSHVRGIITDIAQTPLSHVNLKAKQNNIPNAYIKNASTNPTLIKLKDKPVHLKVEPEGYEINEVTYKDVSDNLRALSPQTASVPEMSLNQKKIIELWDVGFNETNAFGAKSSNLGELLSVIPNINSVKGHAVPFYYYDYFMKENNLYVEVEKLLGSTKNKANIVLKEEQLKQLREKIREGHIPEWMMKDFSDLRAAYSEGSSLRLRSSSNSEDLEDFNGAGLYESLVYSPEICPLDVSIKEVWASLWTLRAFTERDFHKIDHNAIAMGILVHSNYDKERNNGVIVTKNLFDSIWKGFYINVQSGQSLVTNPDTKALPDELLVSEVGANRKLEIQYIRHSNLISKGTNVMQENEILKLVNISKQIHEHFKVCYSAEDDNEFAMEIEFLTSSAGDIKVLQARPWLD